MFINDVGQNTWEEINDGIAGSNYGWPTWKALRASEPKFSQSSFQYAHTGTTSTTGCAIVGGGFYNPTTVQFPASYVGKYFFADLCNGWIRVFDPSNNTAATCFRRSLARRSESRPVTAVSTISRSDHQPCFEFNSRRNGRRRSLLTRPIKPYCRDNRQPSASWPAAAATLSYQWQRNQVNISGATSSTYMIASSCAFRQRREVSLRRHKFIWHGDEQ